jgi:mannose-1-phosphate guanylyltransferase
MNSIGRVAIILASGGGERLGSRRQGPGKHLSIKRISQSSASSRSLEQTRHRVALTFPAEQTMTVATRALQSSLESIRANLRPTGLVLQPQDRGTAPQILYALLRLQKVSPRAEVAIFPSHHYVEDGKAFMRHVDLAFEGIRSHPDLLVLLGVVPDSPATDCSWIEMGNRIPEYLRFFQIRRFWEKPSANLATRLWRRGLLWNSSVLVARLSVLLLVMRKVFPELLASFDPLCATIGTEKEGEIAEAVYRSISDLDFAHQLSITCPSNLAVFPVSGVDWRDLGSNLNIEASLSDRRVSQ